MDIRIFIIPLAAFLIGLCAVPIVRRIAVACGFLDNPDRCRKLQDAPIALGGGIAVWLATWSGWGIGLNCLPWETRGAGHAGWFLAALMLASLLILGLGIIDDRICLRGRHKLAGQVVAAVVLVGMGLRIDAWSCFGVRLELGILAYPASVFWVVLVVNAFNLIDGMDGFCGGLGLVASVAITLLAYSSGRFEDAMVAAALAGALAAFLGFNLPPARIYLGDAGSMVIGMMVSALSVRSCTDRPGGSVWLMPVLALLTLPILDVVIAAGRRWLKGRSIFEADREHVHHCLRNRLGSVAASLFAAGSLAILGAGGFVLATMYRMGDAVACLALALSISLLICTDTFGANELRLLLFRIKVALSPLWTGMNVRGRGIGQECHLRGNRDWGGVWDALVREGEGGGVWRIELAIDMTAAGEVYQGHWSSPTAAMDRPHWSVVHSLYAGKVQAGVIRVFGTVDACGSPYLNRVERLVRLVECCLVSDSHPLSAAAPSSPPHMTVPVNRAVA